jgi:hypothetical protein
MLASTVQFSNNDQDHHQHPTPTHRRHAAQAGCTGPAALRPTPHRPPLRAPDTGAIRRSSHRKAAVPSGPNSVSCAHPVPTQPRSHPTPGARRTRSCAGSKRAVVDVPP